jgi:hypothetical protein
MPSKFSMCWQENIPTAKYGTLVVVGSQIKLFTWWSLAEMESHLLGSYGLRQCLVPDVRCVGRLPPSEVHLPDELFSSTTTTDRSIHSRPHLFFLIHTSLLPWCCSSHPNGQQNCSFSERWSCPLRLLLREAALPPRNIKN